MGSMRTFVTDGLTDGAGYIGPAFKWAGPKIKDQKIDIYTKYKKNRILARRNYSQ